jgi:predicted nucleic acid-binding protein
VVRLTCRLISTIISMETKNNRTIADSSALVSLIVATDSNHGRALEEARRLRSVQGVIILPSAVLLETVDILGKKISHKVAAGALRWFRDHDNQFVITQTNMEQISEALVIFEQQKESVSFTDCVVMATASAYSTKDIFGFDKQFEDAGYKRLAPARKEAA